MNDAEVFEKLKAEIESLKNEQLKNQLRNSLTIALTLPSKGFRKKAQDIFNKCREAKDI